MFTDSNCAVRSITFALIRHLIYEYHPVHFKFPVRYTEFFSSFSFSLHSEKFLLAMISSAARFSFLHSEKSSLLAMISSAARFLFLRSEKQALYSQ
ncbi:hypothetical protein CS542_06895 [Pedobacter sp. IW39]|nr:hypothetical protein CS542_06895 [Pedobacter sp. IW39]